MFKKTDSSDHFNFRIKVSEPRKKEFRILYQTDEPPKQKKNSIINGYGSKTNPSERLFLNDIEQQLQKVMQLIRLHCHNFVCKKAVEVNEIQKRKINKNQILKSLQNQFQQNFVMSDIEPSPNFKITEFAPRRKEYKIVFRRYIVPRNHPLPHKQRRARNHKDIQEEIQQYHDLRFQYNKQYEEGLTYLDLPLYAEIIYNLHSNQSALHQKKIIFQIITYKFQNSNINQLKIQNLNIHAHQRLIIEPYLQEISIFQLIMELKINRKQQLSTPNHLINQQNKTKSLFKEDQFNSEEETRRKYLTLICQE